LFLDACHSGAVSGGVRCGVLDMNTVVKDFSSAERGV
jgi:hypothetical protein